MDNIALVTGATAGIGKATALLLAKNGYPVIITGRRKQKLDDLASLIESESSVKVKVLNFDIRNKKEVEEQIDNLPEAWQNIAILVNNAGLASGLDFIHEGDIDDWERMIDTNIKGLLYITRKVSPLMIARKKGHIVNIGSIAGKEVYLKGNVYCATKHAVDALNKGMRMDLLAHGIKVTAINPGLADTEFSMVRFHGDAARAKTVYEGYEPLHAEDIAETILFAVTRPKHVNINDLLIMPTVQANSIHIIKDNQ